MARGQSHSSRGTEAPSRWRYDEKHELRIITDATDFEGIANDTLNQLRQYGCRSIAVTIRLLEALARIGPHVVRQSDRAILTGHARKIRDDCIAAAASEPDQRDIDEAFVRARDALTKAAR